MNSGVPVQQMRHTCLRNSLYYLTICTTTATAAAAAATATATATTTTTAAAATMFSLNSTGLPSTPLLSQSHLQVYQRRTSKE